MRSLKSEALLRRIREALPKPAPRIVAPRVREPDPEVGLQEDLQQTLDAVGPQQYAHTTARLFAPGGKYNRPVQRKYAIT